jgi:hypothetical protein
LLVKVRRLVSVALTPRRLGTKVPSMTRKGGPEAPQRVVERVQTGVRIEKRMLLVLRALAASKGLSLGDLLEGIVLHAFEGAAPFGAESIAKIDALKKVYGLDLDARDSHLLVERRARRGA